MNWAFWRSGPASGDLTDASEKLRQELDALIEAQSKAHGERQRAYLTEHFNTGGDEWNSR